MSISKCYTAHLIGLNAEIVTVEVDISNGLNAVSIVGLGDRSVDEARDRISAAIKNSGYTSPKQKNQKVVISLAPADVRKEGASFDLAMAIGYLLATNEIMGDVDNMLFIGELSLEGKLRQVAGILPILCDARRSGFKTAFIPIGNTDEAMLAEDITIYAVSNLEEVISFLNTKSALTPLNKYVYSETVDKNNTDIDMSTVRGNDIAKRGLEIAAAGAHNILMFGPPGTGKTMLAQSFKSILPPLSRDESVEVTSIHSAAKILNRGLICWPPFRAPHHTASYPAIVGGGAIPRPGEITLAHRGILFLDEFPEFDRSVLEALRQPLEDRKITIARAKGTLTFPAQCILIASMNPCPCGKPSNSSCTCTPATKTAYRRKISGPIMDRLDIWVNVNKIDYDKLSAVRSSGESSVTIASRVKEARIIQRSRFEKLGINKKFNAEMDARDIERAIDMSEEARAILNKTARRLNLSGRSFHRVAKVARTIADLAHKTQISQEDILEAVQYRQKMDDA